MSKVDISVKDILAQLMATEKLSIEHRSGAHTAAFDLKNRILILPIWKEMDDHLYNMLIGHEVGHALYTPQDYIEEVKKNASLSSYLNVVEDARIEKIIKNDFPGIRRSFREAYQQLNKRDFFGRQKTGNLKKYDLIDRINLHFKLNSYISEEIAFTDEEKFWVEKVDSCKTFSDVVRVAKELFKYQKEQNQQQQKAKISEDGDGKIDSGTMEKDNSEENSSTSDSSEEFQDSETNQSKADQDSDEKDKNLQDPFSETDQNLQENLKNLRDEFADEYAYVDFPNLSKEEISNYIIPFQTVHRQIREHYIKEYERNLSYTESHRGENCCCLNELKEAENRLSQFKSESIKVVNYLVKEFEMKKAAHIHDKTRISKTGVIDMNKLFSYKYNDDIFKRSSVVSTGKNHGILIFFDMSNSMSSHMAGTIEQMINLVLFCKKVQIPFEVYGFTTCDNNSRIDSAPNVPKKEIILGNHFTLRNYFSHRMNSGQFQNALVNMMAILHYYEIAKEYPTKKYSLPTSEQLHYTPLNQTIIIATHLVPLIQRKYNIEIMNCIFITDGCHYTGGQDLRFIDYDGFSKSLCQYQKIFIKKDNKQYESNSREDNFTKIYFEILKKSCQTNNIGFFILQSGKSGFESVISQKDNNLQNKSKTEKKDIINKLYDQYQNDGFFNVQTAGYDDYFVVPGGDQLRTHQGYIPVKPGASRLKITKAFKKSQAIMITSRVMLSKFIDRIV